MHPQGLSKLAEAPGGTAKAVHHVHETSPVHACFLVHVRKPIDSGTGRIEELFNEDIIILGVRRAFATELPIGDAACILGYGRERSCALFAAYFAHGYLVEDLFHTRCVAIFYLPNQRSAIGLELWTSG